MSEEMFVSQTIPDALKKIFDREQRIFGEITKKPMQTVTITHDRLREYTISRPDSRCIDWGELHELVRFMADELGLFKYDGLKEQNKQLMQENVGLKDNVFQLAEIMTELFSKIEKLQSDYNVLRDKEFETYEENMRLRAERETLRKIISDTNEPHLWYDADKCLPLPNKNVYIIYKWFDRSMPRDNAVPVKALFECKEHGAIFVRHNESPKLSITHSYPGVILKWCYADDQPTTGE